MSHEHLNPLTPRERTAVEERAYRGWLDRTKIYNPPPEPKSGDLIHENRVVMNVLTNLVGWLPALMGIVMVGAIIVSLDKTAAAFEASVAHRHGLWGVWPHIVSAAAVVMTDGALIVAEFARVRDMLSKGLHREVVTWNSLVQGWKVFWGKAQPKDWHEMADPTLAFYTRFLFWLVVGANLYGVSTTDSITSVDDLTFINGLRLFIGIAGALSLRFIGRWVAHNVYELARKRERLERDELYEDWRRELMQLWEEQGPTLVQRALHEKFLSKNKLPLDASSPYLLMAGQDEAGEVTVETVPFQSSSPPWHTEWPTSSPPNGRPEPTPKR